MGNALQYQIAYYEIDARGRIAWDHELDVEVEDTALEALESAKRWLTTDGEVDLRTVQPDGACVYMYASAAPGDPYEDTVAIITKV